MSNQNSKIKYFVYVRKSSESEDRQVQSINDQVDRLKQLAIDYNLNIVRIFEESKTAKKPNNRPIFSDMMSRIEKGEASGILCWQINRLSRNPVDSGMISWVLQRGILESIQTIDRQYLPQDNVLIFNVESGVANQFILDLSKNVKRGIDRKLNNGWRPGLAPQGYLNELVEHTIIKDPDRFSLIRKAWDLMLTGNYTVPKILDKLNNEWGYRTVKHKRIGDNPLTMSGLYNIFTSLFYTGIIVHNNQEYSGKHDPMVTLGEYDHVQEILGRKGKPRPFKHEFAFTGVMRCGECGCMITAENKKKVIKATGLSKTYTYYRCTHKKRNHKCKQPAVSIENLESQILEELKKYEISPEFKDWALEVLKENNDKEVSERSKIHDNINRTIASTQAQLDNLIKMRIRGLINDDEFTKEKSELQNTITKFRGNLRETEDRADNWIELAEKAFLFATHASAAFQNGDTKTKKEILVALGSDCTLTDKKFSIKSAFWLEPMEKANFALNGNSERFGPVKIPINTTKNRACDPISANWQGWQESNPR